MMHERAGALFAVWGLLTLGCGATTSRGEPAGGGGTAAGSAAEGGQSPGGSAAVGGGAGSPTVTSSPLEPGTCGVVRTIALPPTRFHVAPVTRQGSGLTLGPWKTGDDASSLHAFLMDEEGNAPRFFAASGSTNDVAWPTMLSGSSRALEVFVSPRTSAGDDTFESRVWAELDDAPLPRGEVLRAPWRGTDGVALTPTLDGTRALFAIFPHGLSEPRAAVLGSDGARLGEAHSFPAVDDIARCELVTPTARGGFVTFVDSSGDLRVFELGGDGELVRQVTWRLPSAGQACPAFTLAESGLAFLLNRATTEERPEVGLYRLLADGAVREIPMTLPPEAREVAMLGDDPLVLRWSPLGAELSRPLRGELWLVTLPAGTPSRVPSEAGSIWLDIREPTVESVDPPRTLVQLSCR